MNNIINLNQVIENKINNIKLDDALKYVRTGEIKSLTLAIERNCFNGQEICIIAEEACRQENKNLTKWILNRNEEILYYYPSDILDIAVGTCNYDILKVVLDSYSNEYTPQLKYAGTCDRAKLNNREDILNLLEEYNIDTSVKECR